MLTGCHKFSTNIQETNQQMEWTVKHAESVRPSRHVPETKLIPFSDDASFLSTFAGTNAIYFSGSLNAFSSTRHNNILKIEGESVPNQGLMRNAIVLSFSLSPPKSTPIDRQANLAQIRPARILHSQRQHRPLNSLRPINPNQPISSSGKWQRRIKNETTPFIELDDFSGSK